MADPEFTDNRHLIDYLMTMGMSRDEAEKWIKNRMRGRSFKTDPKSTDNWSLIDYLIAMGMSRDEAEKWIKDRNEGRSFKKDPSDMAGAHLDRIFSRSRITFSIRYLLVVGMVLLSVSMAVNSGPQYSIPTNGRRTALIVGLQIQSTPTWAHDVVLHAAKIWNQAQLWYEQNASLAAATYTFVEEDNGNATATVSFSMPQAVSGIAVGWTVYTYAPGSSKTLIVSTRTFLTPNVFNPAQENNATAQQYALWLALHELGRVLGLGSVLDSYDIMDPLWTPTRLTPTISTLDLYAVCIMASGTTLSFVTLPDGVADEKFAAPTFITPGETPQPVIIESSSP